MDLTGTTTPQPGSSETRLSEENRITPQLVREIADIVYAMLLHDLKIEGERLGLAKSQINSKSGGQS